MRKSMILLCLLCGSFAGADDPGVRAEFQAKYDAAFAALASGNERTYADLCGGSLTCADLQKRTQGLSAYLKSFEKPKGSLAIKVESADTLDTAAKTAVRITMSWTATENGKAVTYRSVRTEEDTWSQSLDSWKLDSVRLTSIQVTRNGRVIQNESEHVLTDWDRHYGRQPSSSPHRRGRSGRRS